jgi:hypothetical protein
MLRHLPIVVSVAALVVAIATLTREPPTAHHVCKDTSAEVKQLEQEVRILRASLAQVRVATTPVFATGAPAVSPSEPPPVANAEPPAPAPRYVRFEAPRGLRIEASDNGAIAVRNDDPALTGKTVVVQAQRDDGTSEPVTITVPPPAQ